MSDARGVKATVKPKGLKKSPAGPWKEARGRKTTTVVRVEVRMGTIISLAPRTTEAKTSSPFSLWW